MKIAVECRSPLLQKSLEIFLSRFLCLHKQCDIIIRDEETSSDSRCFYISTKESADLKKPFSKSQLILALEKRYATLDLQAQTKSLEMDEDCLDFSILEKRIESLTDEYKNNILRVVKAFYEK